MRMPRRFYCGRARPGSWTSARRFGFRRPLQIAQLETVHAIDDARVGARRRFEPRPGYGLWRLAVRVEVHIEVSGVDAGHESKEAAEVARRRRLLGLGVDRDSELAERGDREVLQLRPGRAAGVPQLRRVGVAAP